MSGSQVGWGARCGPGDAEGEGGFFGDSAGVRGTWGDPVLRGRMGARAGAAGRWIGTGVERFIGDDGK